MFPNLSNTVVVRDPGSLFPRFSAEVLFSALAPAISSKVSYITTKRSLRAAEVQVAKVLESNLQLDAPVEPRRLHPVYTDAEYRLHKAQAKKVSDMVPTKFSGPVKGSRKLREAAAAKRKNILSRTLFFSLSPSLSLPNLAFLFNFYYFRIKGSIRQNGRSHRGRRHHRDRPPQSQRRQA